MKLAKGCLPKIAELGDTPKRALLSENKDIGPTIKGQIWSSSGSLTFVKQNYEQNTKPITSNVVDVW